MKKTLIPYLKDVITKLKKGEIPKDPVALAYIWPLLSRKQINNYMPEMEISAEYIEEIDDLLSQLPNKISDNMDIFLIYCIEQLNDLEDRLELLSKYTQYYCGGSYKASIFDDVLLSSIAELPDDKQKASANKWFLRDSTTTKVQLIDYIVTIPDANNLPKDYSPHAVVGEIKKLIFRSDDPIEVRERCSEIIVKAINLTDKPSLKIFAIHTLVAEKNKLPENLNLRGFDRYVVEHILAEAISALPNKDDQMRELKKWYKHITLPDNRDLLNKLLLEEEDQFILELMDDE